MLKKKNGSGTRKEKTPNALGDPYMEKHGAYDLGSEYYFQSPNSSRCQGTAELL